jgi:hypothetical protein
MQEAMVLVLRDTSCDLRRFFFWVKNYTPSCQMISLVQAVILKASRMMKALI